MNKDFKPGDQVWVKWRGEEREQLYTVTKLDDFSYGVQVRLTSPEDNFNCAPINIVRHASEEEIYWCKTLNREKVSDFKLGDIYIDKECRAEVLEKESHVELAKEWYAAGDFNGLYPGESFKPSLERRCPKLSRADRRRESREHRPVGWTSHPSPKDLKTGSGWFGEFDRVFRKDNDFVVMVREVQTDWGLVTHLCMRNTDSTDIPWAQKQQIKNELFGEETTAIEVFPKESELVDDANMYHLWILPETFDLPFGITRLG